MMYRRRCNVVSSLAVLAVSARWDCLDFFSRLFCLSLLYLSPSPPNHHPLSEKQVDSEKLSQMYDDPNGSLFICILFHNSEF